MVQNMHICEEVKNIQSEMHFDTILFFMAHVGPSQNPELAQHANLVATKQTKWTNTWIAKEPQWAPGLHEGQPTMTSIPIKPSGAVYEIGGVGEKRKPAGVKNNKGGGAR